MRVLVLGGSTFVGRRLVSALVAGGDDVAVLNRGRTPSALPDVVERLVADRTDAASLTAALADRQWDAVVDVSGFVMVAGGAPLRTLLDLLDGRTGAYVFVSSVMAYAPSPVMPWTEGAPWRDEPETTYGGFKAHAERTILDLHARTGFPGSIARPAAIYGPENNILDMEAAMWLRLRRGRPVLVPHSGLVTTSYGHVDDLCALLRAMAGLPGCAGQVVNATGEAVTALGYVQTLARIAGVEADVRLVPDDALPGLLTAAAGPAFGHLFGERHHGVLSTAKAAALGLPAERGFVRGHEETFAWFTGSGLEHGPDVARDPVWGAGYDFAAEDRALAALGAARIPA